MTQKPRQLEPEPTRLHDEPTVSVCPAGERFPLPSPEDYDSEFKRLQWVVSEQRLMGREIVVVMGVGFVGAVMAGIVADSVDRATGTPSRFVIGMQRPSTRSYWKIHYLNRGLAPVQAEDPEVAPMIERCVLEKKTLTATFTYDALTLADVVVVDVQCDYFKETLGNVRQGRAEIAALEESLKIIGERINPEAARPAGCGAAPGPLLRTGHARPQLRLLHPGFLAGLQRHQRQSAGACPGVPLRRPQRGAVPSHGVEPPHRKRNLQDRRELLPGHHPGIFA
ncbi:MAG: hypothetical protein MUC41_05690 [Syntrophobacteraceae bacterium]|nr:hypothetical protein [Syntrophobacteraceae bacterium]